MHKLGPVLNKKSGIRAYFVGTSDLDGKYTLVVIDTIWGD